MHDSYQGNVVVTGRTTVFTKEVPEGEEAGEPTEEESEQGPEPLSTLDKDAEVEGGEAWTPLLSSTNTGVKNQVLCSLHTVQLGLHTKIISDTVLYVWLKGARAQPAASLTLLGLTHLQ